MTAGNFAVLAGTTITNTGPSLDHRRHRSLKSAGITLDFLLVPPVLSTPTTARTPRPRRIWPTYTPRDANPTTTDYSNVNLGGKTLGPGVYYQSTAPTLTGTLTLSGRGVYIFLIGSTARDRPVRQRAVSLINGAQPCDIFWAVASSATIATLDHLCRATIMALASIADADRRNPHRQSARPDRGCDAGHEPHHPAERMRRGFTQSFPVPAYVAPPTGNILPATLGVPGELINEIPWLLVIAVGAGLGAIVLVVSNRRRRRRQA